MTAQGTPALGVRRSWRFGAVIAAALIALGAVVAPTKAAAADVGFLGPSLSGSTAPTGQKPQSKLWWNAGKWWGVLFDSSSRRFMIWRFEWSSNTWTNTGVVVDTRTNSSSDALWTGSHLFIATHVKEGGSASNMNAELRRYSYVAATDTYQLDAGFPTNLTSGAIEALVIDADSLGRVWATWTASNGAGGRQAMVTRTDPGGTGLITPFVIPLTGAANLQTDDISTIVSFTQADGIPKIGVLWSNQNDNAMYFAFHADSAADTTWTLNPLVQGPEWADDHMNIKGLQADPSGNVYAVTKTSFNNAGQPLLIVSILDNTGSWQRRTFSTAEYNQTRPILLLDTENRDIYVFAATPCCSGGIIHMKSADMDNPNFVNGVGTPFIEQATSTTINNPTSTKQALNSTTDLLVLAGDDNSKRYVFNKIDLQPGGGGDFTPPDTSITSGPSGTVSSTSATFQFTSTEAGSTFACSLDGAAPSPCTSGITYTNLAEGPHTFTVAATDQANNPDLTPASRTWTVETVDLTPPDTSITSGPSGTVSSTSATFQFTSTEAGSTFACSLDGAAPSPCTSGITYTNLAEGPHTFTVAATDQANNPDQTPASRTWTIDTTAPAGIIRQSTSTAVATSSIATATVAAPTGTQANDVLVACIATNGATIPTTPAGWTRFAALTSLSNPKMYGYYRVAGGAEPSSYSWTLSKSAAHSVGVARYSGVDTTTPIDASSTASGGSASSGTVPALTTTVSETMLGGCMAINTSSTSVGIAPPSGLTEIWDIGGKRQEYADGTQTNAGPSGAKTWTFTSARAWAGWLIALRPAQGGGGDLTPPDTSITSGPSGTVASNAAAFEFTSTEAGSTFACSLDGAAAAPCTSGITYTNLAEGPHTFTVAATDAANNPDPTPASRTWTVETVDLTPPDTSITSGPTGTVSSTSAIFQFTSTETGSTFACSLDGAAPSPCTSGITYTNLADGPHTFTVAATDAADNPDLTPASRTWTIDTSLPTGIVRESTSTQVNSTTANTLTVATPTGTQTNDVLVACVALNGATIPTTPAGWTRFAAVTSITNPKMYGFYRVAGASEPTSYTWNLSSSVASSGAIARYSGVDTTTPIDASSTATGASATSGTVPAITTTVDNTMLAGCMAVNSSSTSLGIAPPAGLTEVWDIGGKRQEYADGLQAAAGSSGAKTWTFTSTREWAGWLVALRPS